MEQVMVKSNIGGYIRNIRRGAVYQDNSVVIDELIQNAQRAHAKRVNIEITSKTISVKDDGKGCKDPQSLFEQNQSAWEDADEAFGEGFFSTFCLASSVYVRSYDWELNLDIDNLIETGDMMVDDIATGQPKAKGFEVIMYGDFSDAWVDMIDRAKEIAKADGNRDYCINDEDVESVDLMDDSDPLAQAFSNDIYDAVFKPDSYGTVNRYYESRPVDSDLGSGYGGIIMFHPGKITLKAPDRKSVIYDNAYHAMKSQVRRDVKDMYLKFIQTATDEQIDHYRIGIEENLSVNEYAPFLDFSEEFLRYVNEEIVQVDPVEMTDEMLDALKGHTTGSKAVSVQSGEVVGGKRKTGVLGDFVDAANGKLVYVMTSDVNKCRDLIELAEYRGLTVIYCPNSLYENAMKFYNVPSIRTMDDVYEEVPLVAFTETTCRAEERFLELMGRFERYLGIKLGTFRVSDIMYNLVNRDSKDIVRSLDKSVAGMYSCDDGGIYINRPFAHFERFDPERFGTDDLTGEDYRLLLAMENTVCHELTHKMYSLKDKSLNFDSVMESVVAKYVEAF